MNGGRRRREEAFIAEAVWERLMQVEVWPRVEVARCSFMQRYGRSARVESSVGTRCDPCVGGEAPAKAKQL